MLLSSGQDIPSKLLGGGAIRRGSFSHLAGHGIGDTNTDHMAARAGFVDIDDHSTPVESFIQWCL